MTLTIDAHQHFWSLTRESHEWPDPEWPAIYHDFLPPDLRQDVKDLNFAGSVLVQAQPNDADTDWALELSENNPRILGVVGWVDMVSPNAPERIKELAKHPKMRGLRPMLQAIEDSDWINSAAVVPAIKAMVEEGLSFDALIEPRHFKAIEKLSRQYPDLQIVIDHGAKPDLTTDSPQTLWEDGIARLSQIPNIWCKLSGLPTQQSIDAPLEDLRPIIAHLSASFGDKLMWGSDWPVVLHAKCDYVKWHKVALDMTGITSQEAQVRLMSGAAREFYRL